MTKQIKINKVIVSNNIKVFYLEFLNIVLKKNFLTLEQLDDFLDEYITERIISKKLKENPNEKLI